MDLLKDLITVVIGFTLWAIAWRLTGNHPQKAAVPVDAPRTPGRDSTLISSRGRN